VIPCFYSLPDYNTAQPESSAVVYDRDGNEIYRKVRKDYTRHLHATYEDLPEHLVQATLAAEDKRFWSHAGVDILATLRSAKDAVEAGRFVSGASTISQQTVKLITPKSPRTLPTKVHEAFMARKLELIYSKHEILALYFNHLDYGNRSVGPHQAALHYFNKPLRQLSLAEAALLAGIPQAPSRHNPRRNPEGAVKRRNWVLDRMQVVYQISNERIQRAKQEPLQLWNSSDNQHYHPELIALINQLHNGDTKIHTTLSLPLHKRVKDITQAELQKLRHKNVNDAAVVVIDNKTGHILCLFGNPNFDSPLGGQINAAMIPRSPGSALKPFTFLLGFDKLGLQPNSIIPDIPTIFPGSNGSTSFVNYSRKFSGPVTVAHALGNSLNIPAIRALNQLGGPEPLAQFLNSNGVNTLETPATEYGLALTIGSGPVTLLELTNAYASIARLGLHRPSRLIRYDRRADSTTRIATTESSYLISDILSDNRYRHNTFGQDSQLRLPFQCAVKTGTSTDYRDNWCLGFTGDYTVGVWVGNLDHTPMKGVSGVDGAGPIFHQVMRYLHRSSTANWPERPNAVKEYIIDPYTGKQLTEHHPRNTSATPILCSREPMQADTNDYAMADGSLRVMLDDRYNKWMNEHTVNRSQFVLAESQSAPFTELKVLSPSHEATYLLDPDLPNQGNTLYLESNLPNGVTWTCETLLIKDYKLQLTPGTHHITAVHSLTAQEKTIIIHVEAL